MKRPSYLKGEETCNVLLWNGVPLSVAAPNFVLLKIRKPIRVCVAIPLWRRQAGHARNRAHVRVPLFVQQGEVVKVDTRTGEYLGRVGK